MFSEANINFCHTNTINPRKQLNNNRLDIVTKGSVKLRENIVNFILFYFSYVTQS